MWPHNEHAGVVRLDERVKISTAFSEPKCKPICPDVYNVQSFIYRRGSGIIPGAYMLRIGMIASGTYRLTKDLPVASTGFCGEKSSTGPVEQEL